MPEQIQEHTSRATGCAGAGGCLNTLWLSTDSPSKVHPPICLATTPPAKKIILRPQHDSSVPGRDKGVLGSPRGGGRAWQPRGSSVGWRAALPSATAARGKVGMQLPLLPPLSGAAAFDRHLLCLYGHIVSLLGKTAAGIQKSSEAGAADALPSSGSQHAHGSH